MLQLMMLKKQSGVDGSEETSFACAMFREDYEFVKVVACRSELFSMGFLSQLKRLMSKNVRRRSSSS